MRELEENPLHISDQLDQLESIKSTAVDGFHKVSEMTTAVYDITIGIKFASKSNYSGLTY